MHLDSKRIVGGRLGRRLLQTAAFALFVLGNPLYLVACSSSADDGDQYEYDRDDMVAVASGLESAGPYPIGEYSVSVEFPFAGELAAGEGSPEGGARALPVGAANGFIARAHACGTRSFVAPAAACIDSSELELRGTLRVARGQQAVELEVTGIMHVRSRILTFANFDLVHDSLQLSFAWNADEGYRYEPSGAEATAALGALFEP